jgi:nitroreductase
MDTRKTDYPIHPLFVERWSPRAFTGEPIPDAILMTCLEAGRWAPSCHNRQPWRFIYSKKDSASWRMFLGFLNEENRVWAKNASVLVILVSKMFFPSSESPGDEHFHPIHSFDAGAAWANVALQSTLLGWHAHGIMGFDPIRVAQGIGLEEGYHVDLIFALGKRGAVESLPVAIRKREGPRDRAPLREIVMKDSFSNG